MADIQDNFYNYMAENMMDNTYDRLIIRRAEGRKNTIVDYDDDCVNGKKTIFGWINGDPRCGIALNATPNIKRMKNRDRTDTK